MRKKEEIAELHGGESGREAWRDFKEERGLLVRAENKGPSERASEHGERAKGRF
jgi:hypothetical protein